MDTKPGHTYKAPTLEDSRSPCPALNAAANHGYLPHSGKGISFFQLARAIHDVYNLTWPLAITLTFGGFILCSKGWSIDLEFLAQHNKIEHDASIVHRNFRDGDNLHICPEMLEQLIASSSNGKGVSLGDFARARVRGEERIPEGKLDNFHAAVSAGELALTVLVMGDGKEIDLDTVKTWFGGEKLPSGWMPHEPTTILGLDHTRRAITSMIEKVKRGEKID